MTLDTRQPSLGLNYFVQSDGVFPYSGDGSGNLAGLVRLSGYNFETGNDADGELFAIAQNSLLFSLYGTIYGGDARTTFGMPDLEGRIAVGEGTGSGLSQTRLGEKTGIEDVLLSPQSLPTSLGGVQTAITNEQPSLGMNYIVRLNGVFPSGGVSEHGFMGQVALFGGNRAPEGWAFAHGQLLDIASNSALFSLLGTAFGGDGRTTFALPDLRGRAAVGEGQGAGLPNVQLGQKFGTETSSLTDANLPASLGGSGLAIDNYEPSLGLKFYVVVNGTFPSRERPLGNELALGEIVAFAGINRIDRNVFEADGQLLPISQYSALFSLYGTAFGGDGRTTFALPDLRGRSPMDFGTGPGLDTIAWGQKVGTPSVVLDVSDLPPTVTDVQLSTATASESDETVITVTLTLSRAVSGDQVVALNVSGPGVSTADFTIASTNITILNGQSTATATLTITDDLAFDGLETATVSVTAVSSGVRALAAATKTFTIADDDAAPVQVNVEDAGETSELASDSALSPGGNMLVTWSQGATGVNPTVLMRLMDADGTALTPELAPRVASSVIVSEPSVFAISDTEFVVTHLQTVFDPGLFRFTTTLWIEKITYDPSAGTLSSSDYRAVTTPGADAGAPISFALLDNGNVLMTYGQQTNAGSSGNLDYFAVVLDSDLNAVGNGPVRVDASMGDIRNVQLVETDAGLAMIYGEYSGSSSNTKIIAASITVDATNNITVTSRDDLIADDTDFGFTFLDAVTLANGDILVVYNGSYSLTDGAMNDSQRLFGQVFDGTLSVVKSEFRIDHQDRMQGTVDVDAVAFDGGGFAVFYGQREENFGSSQDIEIFVQRYDNTYAADGAVQRVTDTGSTISNTGTTAHVINDEGDMTIVWHSGVNLNADIAIFKRVLQDQEPNPERAVNLSVSAAAGTEADGTVITVTVTSTGAVNGAQTVDVAVTGTDITAGDFTLSASTVTIADGATTGSVTFTVTDDALVEALETAVVTMSNPSAGIVLGTTTSQTIQITSDDLPALTVTLNQTSVVEGGMVTGTVTREGDTAAALTVALASDDTSEAVVPLSVTIPAGQTSVDFTVSAADDSTIDGTQSATISATATGFDAGSAVLGVSDNDPDLTGAPRLTAAEDTKSNFDLSGMTFSDPDSPSVTLTLKPGLASFDTPVSSGGVTATLVDATTVTLTGTPADLEAYLNDPAAVQFTPFKDYNGNFFAGSVIIDDGAGAGTAKGVAVPITVTPVNDAPTATGLPIEVTLTEDTQGNVDLSGLTLADVDSASIDVLLSASEGTFAAPADGTAAGVMIPIAGATAIMLRGSPAAISTYFDTPGNIKYTGALNAAGSPATSIAVVANDNDGSNSVTLGQINVTITPVNDAPTATTPPTLANVTEDTESHLDLSSLTIADVDSASVTVTVTVSAGTLPVPADGTSLSVTAARATDQSVTLTGAPAAINAYLDVAGNLTYTPALNVNGPASATFSVTVNDGDGSGDVALVTDAPINVQAVNDAPVLTGVDNAPSAGPRVPVVLDANMQVSDVELDAANGGSGDYAGASVTFERQGGANANDTFAFFSKAYLVDTTNGTISTNNGDVFATFSALPAGTLTISLTSTDTAATSALVDTVLQSVAYSNAGSEQGSVTLAVTFSDGALSDSDETLTLTVDTLAPLMPGTPDLQAASDSGVSDSDDLTDETSVVIDVTAEAGSNVTLTSDIGGVIGTAAATGGTATVTTSTLAEGVHTITAVARDAAGNASSASAPLVVTVDSTQPSLSVLDLVDASDTGSSNSDDATAELRPTIALTAEAGATLAVNFDDGNGFVAAGRGTGASQTLTLGAAYLTEGAKTVTVRATDDAGNETTQTLSILINSAPTDVVLNSASVPENSADGTVVGTFGVIDPTVGDAQTLTLIDDASGRFDLQGNTLVVANGALLDFETFQLHQVTVAAIDGIGSAISKTFDITVGDVFEATSQFSFVSPGSQSFEGTTQDDRFVGTAASFNGDTFNNFEIGDSIEFISAGLDPSQISFSGSNPTQVVVDLDGTGPMAPQSSFTINGDFSGGDFMVVNMGGQTIISFEAYLPTLSEGTQVDPSTINGINNQPFLQGTGTKDFTVEMKSTAGADFDNAIGVYEITPTGEIVDVEILAANAKDTSGSPFLLDSVDAGNALSFFLVRDGFEFIDGLSAGDALSFVDDSGEAANALAAQEIFLAVNGNVASALDTFHTYAAALNPNGATHVLSGVDEGGASITLGFEDSFQFDDDFQDVVLTIGLA